MMANQIKPLTTNPSTDKASQITNKRTRMPIAHPFIARQPVPATGFGTHTDRAYRIVLDEIPPGTGVHSGHSEVDDGRTLPSCRNDGGSVAKDAPNVRSGLR